MYKKFTGIVFLLLSGCSLHPYTKVELLNTGVASPEYCLAQERSVVEKRVQGYLNHCFHPQVTALTTGGTLVNTIQLKVDRNTERSDMVLWAPTIYGDQFYMNVVVSEKKPACQTTMTAVASGWSFERNFPKILESANGGDPWCPL